MWFYSFLSFRNTAPTLAKIIFEQLINFGSSRKSSGVVGARIALLKLASRCWPILTERIRRTYPCNPKYLTSFIVKETCHIPLTDHFWRSSTENRIINSIMLQRPPSNFIPLRHASYALYPRIRLERLDLRGTYRGVPWKNNSFR